MFPRRDTSRGQRGRPRGRGQNARAHHSASGPENDGPLRGQRGRSRGRGENARAGHNASGPENDGPLHGQQGQPRGRSQNAGTDHDANAPEHDAPIRGQRGRAGRGQNAGGHQNPRRHRNAPLEWPDVRRSLRLPQHLNNLLRSNNPNAGPVEPIPTPGQPTQPPNIPLGNDNLQNQLDIIDEFGRVIQNVRTSILQLPTYVGIEYLLRGIDRAEDLNEQQRDSARLEELLRQTITAENRRGTGKLSFFFIVYIIVVHILTYIYLQQALRMRGWTLLIGLCKRLIQ